MLALSVFGGLGMAGLLIVVIGVAAYFIWMLLNPVDPTPGLMVDVPGDTTEVVTTTLQVSPAEAVEARLQGERGFRGRFMGPSPVTAQLPAGSYTTKVEREVGKPIRGRIFELTGTQCTVTLDLSAERWDAQCD